MRYEIEPMGIRGGADTVVAAAVVLGTILTIGVASVLVRVGVAIPW